MNQTSLFDEARAWLMFWKRKIKPPETLGEKAERLRKALIFNPDTCEYEITREYRDAVIDEIIGAIREPSQPVR